MIQQHLYSEEYFYGQFVDQSEFQFQWKPTNTIPGQLIKYNYLERLQSNISETYQKRILIVDD